MRFKRSYIDNLSRSKPRKARLKIRKENIGDLRSVLAEMFIKELEGCIKDGALFMDPLNLGKMWGLGEKYSDFGSGCAFSV